MEWGNTLEGSVVASKSSAKSRSKEPPRKPRRPGRVLAIGVLAFSVAGLASAVLGLFGDDQNNSQNNSAIISASDGRDDNTPDAGSATSASADVAGVEAEVAAQSALTEAPPRLGQYQELVDLDGWINSNAVDLGSFSGQVRIVKFWTFGCVNCKNTLPHLREIYSRWQPEGLEIVGVHSPEFDFERDPEAVSQATVDQSIPWPVALDTDKTNFHAWQGSRRFWPRTYVIDQSGQLRYDHIGEGRYDELEATVSYLIQNPGA